jgi:hypothetical protein
MNIILECLLCIVVIGMAIKLVYDGIKRVKFFKEVDELLSENNNSKVKTQVTTKGKIYNIEISKES